MCHSAYPLPIILLIVLYNFRLVSVWGLSAIVLTLSFCAALLFVSAVPCLLFCTALLCVSLLLAFLYDLESTDRLALLLLLPAHVVTRRSLHHRVNKALHLFTIEVMQSKHSKQNEMAQSKHFTVLLGTSILQ